MRFILLLIAFIVSTFSSHAQRIAVCDAYHDTIYVGETVRSFVSPVGHYYFMTDVDGINPIIVANISKWAARGPGMDGLVDSSMRFLKRESTAYFTTVRRADPKFFDDSLMEGRANVLLGHLCFLGTENGRPRLVYVAVYMNKGIRHPVVISFSKEDAQTAIIGATKMWPTTKVFGNFGLSRVGWIKTRMALYMGRDPDGAGAKRPIDVLVFTRDGGVWMRQ